MIMPAANLTQLQNFEMSFLFFFLATVSTNDPAYLFARLDSQKSRRYACYDVWRIRMIRQDDDVFVRVVKGFWREMNTAHGPMRRKEKEIYWG